MHDPDLYDCYSQFQRRDAKELVPYLVSNMTPKNSQTVLDFGCGTGYNTSNVILSSLEALSVSNSLKVYAVDLSQKMIEFASVKYKHPNITYMVADVMKNDCELPCKFDKIFSFHVLHWISDQKKALKALWILLKVNGEIGFYYISNAAVFSVYEKMSQISDWEPYMNDVKSFIPKSYFSHDPAKDMRSLMASLGYFVQEALNCKRKFCFDTFSEMIEAAMAANPFIHRIPEEKREAYKTDFCHCFMPLITHVPTELNPGAIEVEYGLVLVRAKRL